MVLLKHLPADSALGRELHGEAAEWKIEHELLAALVDITNVARWQFAVATFPKAPKTPPEQVPRPRSGHRPQHPTAAASQSAPRRHATHAEMAKVFGLKLRKGYRPPEDVELDQGRQRRPVRHRQLPEGDSR